jgi:hypothetical protein
VIVAALTLLSAHRNLPRTDTEAWLRGMRLKDATGIDYTGKGLPNRLLSLWKWPNAHAAIDVIVTVPEVSKPWLNAKKLLADTKQTAQGSGVSCHLRLR